MRLGDKLNLWPPPFGRLLLSASGGFGGSALESRSWVNLLPERASQDVQWGSTRNGWHVHACSSVLLDPPGLDYWDRLLRQSEHLDCVRAEDSVAMVIGNPPAPSLA